MTLTSHELNKITFFDLLDVQVVNNLLFTSYVRMAVSLSLVESCHIFQGIS